jgi:phosphatidylserine/phosphatidylglycerophosphate/cardiolipin synthase-like enzyme
MTAPTTTSSGVVALEALQPASPDWPKARIEEIRGPLTLHTFVSPDCSFSAMRELLGRAERSLLIYIYNVSSPSMLGLIRDAIGRGVNVRIMYDATDTRDDEVAKLKQLQVDLKVAPSKNPRRAFTVCHQKFVVVDSSLVIVGSANWATTSIPDPGTKPWKKGNREWIVALESRAAAALFKDLFDTDWKWEPPPEELAELALPVRVIAPILAELPLEIPPADQILSKGKFALDEDAVVTPLFSPQNYLESVSAALKKARKSVWIQQQYIQAPEDNSPFVGELLDVLKRRKSSLEIRIVTSAKFPSGWDNTLDTLSRYGLKAKLKTIDLKQFTHCHNKGVIIDGKTVVVSSTNWSDNSIGAAREAGIIVTNAEVAQYFARAFDFDWRTGVRPQDLESVLEAVSVEAPVTEEVHPADLALT